jgi:glycosyltransferase involved in cell wall biosynthesis
MISFIVPAFNEEGNVLKTVAAILAATADAGLADCEIVLIDDGSSDGTWREIEMAAAAHREVRPLKNPGNLGLGASIRAGISAASGTSFMVVPGDNDVPSAFITLMLRFRGEADIILTAPLNKEQRTIGRNVLSMLYQMAYMIVFDVYVSYLNGPGIWPTAASREAMLRSRRFSIIAELNVKLLRMGCTFAEVPGYFQAGPKVRRTVTLRNLGEVISSFLRLAIDVRIRNRPRFAKRPTRKQIDFLSLRK